MGTGSVGVRIRKKPPVIHAIQWLGHNLPDVCAWLREHTLCDDAHMRQWQNDAQPTLVIDDKRFVAVGRWLVKTDELTIMDDRAFALHYEVIE